ncbi:MAG: hypothetical protein ABI243_15840, partial [Lapillicoccus sp.]
ALLEALVLVGFAVFYVMELVAGGGDDTARVVTSAIVIVISALGLGALARGWWAVATWTRTPTLVWNVLLLPVGASLLQAGQGLVGTLVLVVAVLSIGAAVAAGGRPRPADEESDGEAADVPGQGGDS